MAGLATLQVIKTILLCKNCTADPMQTRESSITRHHSKFRHRQTTMVLETHAVYVPHDNI